MKEIENNIVDIKQLFLLCGLRGFPEAKNLEEYPWTIKHHTYVQNKLVELLSVCNKEERMQREKEFEEEAKQNFSIFEIKKRVFVLRQNDFGFSLCDTEQDLSWYNPSSSPLIEASKWAYKGTFELIYPLSEKEKFILETYSCL